MHVYTYNHYDGGTLLKFGRVDKRVNISLSTFIRRVLRYKKYKVKEKREVTIYITDYSIFSILVSYP